VIALGVHRGLRLCREGLEWTQHGESTRCLPESPNRFVQGVSVEYSDIAPAPFCSAQEVIVNFDRLDGPVNHAMSRCCRDSEEFTLERHNVLRCFVIHNDRDSVVIGQSVDISATNGSGTKFRGSVGTWHNLFAFVDFSSSDINVDAVVTSTQGEFLARDEFDYTGTRVGVGVKWSLTTKTDLYGAVSYDSTDLDFGSFAGEDFDVGDKDVGAEVGIRSVFRDKFELRANVRYSSIGDVDLNTRILDTDTLFGVGFGYELIRGLSITADFESGQFSSWNIGFRLDLDED
jgi:hypothetical protein